MGNKKYYWLKLKKDFFKRHDIRIIEEMPNGKDYILFYLKLLVESIDHEGCLRFSETVPYNEQMLSVITHTNIDIVRSAMKVFLDLKMIEVYTDETIFMSEVTALIGSETAWAEKKRVYRKNQKETKRIGTKQGQNKDNVLTNEDIVRQEIDKDIRDKSIENRDKELESFSLLHKEKDKADAPLVFENEKQKTVYREFFEEVPILILSTSEGPLKIYLSQICMWERNYLNVDVNRELLNIQRWLDANLRMMNIKETISFIERWLMKHQREDKLSRSDLEELKEKKALLFEEEKQQKARIEYFIQNMNDMNWIEEWFK